MDACTTDRCETANNVVASIRGGSRKRLAADKESRLLRHAQKGSERATNELLKSHIGLVHAEAKRHRWTGLAYDDLVGEGVIGLLEAIRRFDTERSTRLCTYAVWWIRASIWDYVWRNRRIVGIPNTRNARKVRVSLWRVQRQLTQELGQPATPEQLAEALGVKEQDVIDIRAALTGRDVSVGDEDDAAPDLPAHLRSPEEEVLAADERAHVRALLDDALEQLPARERTIVERRLLSEDKPSLSALGVELGVSRERVRQLQRRAERTLRTALADVA